MEITEPTLLLDAKKCRKNISAMCAKAKKHALAFRPHFKTHQSRTIGGWFRDEGITAITVSSLKMAGYFADDGWNDITVAFPVNILEIDRIRSLASRVSLNLLLVAPESAKLLDRYLDHPAGVFIKIDAGYHRTGIASTDIASIDRVLAEITNSRTLKFRGFLAHSGHTYRAKSREEILSIHESTLSAMKALKAHYRQSHPDLILSIGDTPGCSLADRFDGIDEIRPGNFVFYDAMQVYLGSCKQEDVAVAMVCPVVATHPERNQIIMYGGAIHFSKDSITPGFSPIYGVPVELHDNGWSGPIEGSVVFSLSQEHGVVSLPPEAMERYPIGSTIGVLPIHSCLTADCMRGYVSIAGERLDHMQGVI